MRSNSVAPTYESREREFSSTGRGGGSIYFGTLRGFDLRADELGLAQSPPSLDAPFRAPFRARRRMTSAARDAVRRRGLEQPLELLSPARDALPLQLSGSAGRRIICAAQRAAERAATSAWSAALDVNAGPPGPKPAAGAGSAGTRPGSQVPIRLLLAPPATPPGVRSGSPRDPAPRASRCSRPGSRLESRPIRQRSVSAMWDPDKDKAGSATRRCSGSATGSAPTALGTGVFPASTATATRHRSRSRQPAGRCGPRSAAPARRRRSRHGSSVPGTAAAALLLLAAASCEHAPIHRERQDEVLDGALRARQESSASSLDGVGRSRGYRHGQEAARGSGHAGPAAPPRRARPPVGSVGRRRADSVTRRWRRERRIRCAGAGQTAGSGGQAGRVGTAGGIAGAGRASNAGRGGMAGGVAGQRRRQTRQRGGQCWDARRDPVGTPDAGTDAAVDAGRPTILQLGARRLRGEFGCARCVAGEQLPDQQRDAEVEDVDHEAPARAADRSSVNTLPVLAIAADDALRDAPRRRSSATPRARHEARARCRGRMSSRP